MLIMLTMLIIFGGGPTPPRNINIINIINITIVLSIFSKINFNIVNIIDIVNISPVRNKKKKCGVIINITSVLSTFW